MSEQELFQTGAISPTRQIHTAEPHIPVWNPPGKRIPVPKTAKVMMCLFAGTLLLTFAIVAVSRRHDSGAMIAFVSGDEGHVYLMTGDGRGRHPAPDGVICVIAPIRSSYGGWNTYNNPCSRAEQPADSPETLVASTLPTSEERSRWSPDRRRIVVMRVPSTLNIVDAERGGERYLAGDYYFPEWSPDGDWIYARPIFKRQSSLDRIHVETGRVEHVLPPDMAYTYWSWSPDAAQIVFTMQTDSGDELFLMGSDGSNLKQIPVDLPQRRAIEPHWSSDGAWIAFLGGRTPSELSIYRIQPDGRDLERLTEDEGSLSELQWSPDGEWLLLLESHKHGTDIMRARADGTSLEKLTSGPGNNFSPQYVPVSARNLRQMGLFIAASALMVTSFFALR